jgi:leucyl aminopeptidase
MGKHSHKKHQPSGDVFGLETTPWIVSASRQAKKDKGAFAKIVILGEEKTPEFHFKDLGIEFSDWIKERFSNKRNEPLMLTTEQGPVWYVAPSTEQVAVKDLGQFSVNSYSRFRDTTSLTTVGVFDYQLTTLVVEFISCSEDERAGALTGLEMGMYRFRTVRQAGKMPTSLQCLGVSEEEIEASGRLGLAVNMARHLVNLPPFDLNPETFSDLAKDLFSDEKHVTVTVLKGDALEKERANLLTAVGRGAEAGPAIVHISYRPEKSKKKPLAFVGKGVTFDSGGLDIKDAASMRMMKKDMGGAGTTLALAWWVNAQQIGRPCDFYLALAENAIDKKSFHPGDIFKSRAGMTVEIDNTDAEGRLVMADVIDYALEQEETPERLINLATLTGAMRIALGTRISGMFANHDEFAAELLSSARQVGEPAWRMPLYDDYFSHLKSTVADFANSGPNRFGGAITAALFLQKFVKDVPWAHFDIYCWTDAGIGGCQEVGGNGQCVQTISRYLLNDE